MADLPKEFVSLAALSGIVVSQSIIVQTLHKSGALNKKDVIDALDFLIADFNKRPYGNIITVPMAQLKKLLQAEYPDLPFSENIQNHKDYPGWFRGVFEGGLSEKKDTEDK